MSVISRIFSVRGPYILDRTKLKISKSKSKPPVNNASKPVPPNKEADQLEAAKAEFTDQYQRLSEQPIGMNPLKPAASLTKVEKVKKAFYRQADKLKRELKEGVHRSPKHLDTEQLPMEKPIGYDGIRNTNLGPHSKVKSTWFKVTREGYYISYQNGSVYFVPSGSTTIKELIVHPGNGWDVEAQLISKSQFQSIIADKPTEEQLRQFYLMKELRYFDDQLDYKFSEALPLW